MRKREKEEGRDTKIDAWMMCRHVHRDDDAYRPFIATDRQMHTLEMSFSSRLHRLQRKTPNAL